MDNFEQCERQAVRAVAARRRLVERKMAKTQEKEQSIDSEALAVVCCILSSIWLKYRVQRKNWPETLREEVFPCESSCRKLLPFWLEDVKEHRRKEVEGVISHKLERMDYSRFANRSNRDPMVFGKRIVRSWYNATE